MACLAILGVVGPALIELGKCMLPPVKRPFNYLFCLTNNIQSLREEAKKLDDARTDLQSRVDTAKNNAERILCEVETWLKDAAHSLTNTNEILKMEVVVVHKGSCFLHPKSRYSLSRKANKEAEIIKKLLIRSAFNTISVSGGPAAAAAVVNMNVIPGAVFIEFGSRKQVEEDVMAALRGENIDNMIVGICGMGGVGKTTMAKKIKIRVRTENLFDEVVIAVVSQPVDVFNIQLQMAEQLDLNLKEYDTIEGRAHRLRTRLNLNRTLVVLDDLWDRINLMDVGIPFGTSDSSTLKCKILLTTRNRHILKEMDAKVCETKILSEDEAWDLFSKVSDNHFNENSNLYCLAQEVARECKGLPLALVIVAMTLKSERDVQPWKDALLQLRNHNPMDMGTVLDGVYNPLRLSYDRLRNENMKNLFLLCSIFPEDYVIPIEELTRYSIGLNMIEFGRSSTSLEEVRDRVYSLVGTLKSRALLLDLGDGSPYVKMHDFVRDVAIFIAQREHSLKMNLAWISKITKERIEFPRLGILDNSQPLRFLTMDNLKDDDLMENQWDEIFYGARDLNVLCFRGIMGAVPQTMQLLKNLQTLHLVMCNDLKSISVIGELTSLEILSLKLCKLIIELPAEIGRLSRLRLLEVLDCESLCTVAPGVISSLVRLEELRMIGSFDGWEGDEEEGNIERRNINASLTELESLTNLSCLEIQVANANLAAAQLSLPPNIIKYGINFGKLRLRVDTTFLGKVVSLDLSRQLTVGNWICTFLKRAEVIHLLDATSMERMTNGDHSPPKLNSSLVLDLEADMNSESGHDKDSFHFCCNQKVAFGRGDGIRRD